MYKAKHSKKQEYKLYSYNDIYDNFQNICSNLCDDDLYLLPLNFFTDLKKFIKFSNFINENIRIKRIKKHDE